MQTDTPSPVQQHGMKTHLRSKCLNWIEYYADRETLRVQFTNGSEYEYPGIPHWKVQGLLHARSHGSYFYQNIAISNSHQQTRLPKNDSDAASVVARSLKNLGMWCEPEALSFVREKLHKIPCLVIPVTDRKTKHGDHTPRALGDFSKVTVNASGNRYQFLITLLHELCHASVYYEHGSGVPPHGEIWKNTFRELLEEATSANLFPPDISEFVKMHSKAPKSSSSRDIGLQIALRAYDTRDCRPTLAELPLGTLCSVDAHPHLLRGEFSGSWIICRTQEGGIRKLSPLTRVNFPLKKPDHESMHDIDLAIAEMTMDIFSNRGDRQKRAVIEYLQSYWVQSLPADPKDWSQLNGNEHWFERMVGDVEAKIDVRLAEKMRLLRSIVEGVVRLKCLKIVRTQRWLESRSSFRSSTETND